MRSAQCLAAIRKVLDAILFGIILFLFFMMFGFTNINVAARYIFNRPIMISNEVARYAYVDLIFIGAIYTMRADKHLSLDFFVTRMPARAEFFFTMLGRILTEAFLAVFTFYSIRMVLNNIHVPSAAMQIPMAVPYTPLVVGGIGMFLEEAILIVDSLKRRKKEMIDGQKDTGKKEAEGWN